MDLDTAILLYLLAGVTIAGQSWSFEHLRRKYDRTVPRSKPRYWLVMVVLWPLVPVVWAGELWLRQFREPPEPPNGST